MYFGVFHLKGLMVFLEASKKNWIAPELQMIKKFSAYQHLLLSGIDSSLPQEIGDVFSTSILSPKQMQHQ